MNHYICRLDNFIMRPESMTLWDEKEMKVMLVNNQGKIMMGDNNIKPVLYSSYLRDAIGFIRFNSLTQHPILLFSIPTEEWDLETHKKEEYDNRYNSYAKRFNHLAQAFSIGAWLEKDSCISSKHAYWINPFNRYVSIIGTSYEPTNSVGLLEETSFSRTEIDRSIEYCYQILGILFSDQRTDIRIITTQNKGTTQFNQEKAGGLVGNKGKSYSRALLKLQEARRTGDITSKIEYHCSALEALYAISKNHRHNISHITAGLIGNSENEKEETIRLMETAYSIRSDHSHGDIIRYLEQNDFSSLDEVGRKLDEIMRKVFRTLLKRPELNFSSEKEEIKKVKDYFDSIKAL